MDTDEITNQITIETTNIAPFNFHKLIQYQQLSTLSTTNSTATTTNTAAHTIKCWGYSSQMAKIKSQAMM
ncbi:hypothetical protein Glove_86g62 [Diversispora epigaea]|uniref:Uncharacterized protein n=1 Tax=Diversispora epigaea TaxID=1348612 RepID=A0A397JDN2_9GLOM|nr:hypothetical protein Glove_86g62 [Diversispora epigaea]